MSAEGKAILELRRQIPSVSGCPKGCRKCCGPVPFSRWEWSRIKDKRMSRGEKDEFCCPYVGETGCDIYEERPVLCRLFGNRNTPKGLICEHHRQLKTAGFVTPAFNARIMEAYLTILDKTGIHGPFAGFITKMDAKLDAEIQKSILQKSILRRNEPWT